LDNTGLSFFAKLLIGVILNQPTLNHGQQVTVLVVDDEPNRAMTPTPAMLELCKPLTMLLVLRIEHSPLSAI
jgi:hypothetical protein